jgi:hypothetical protein
MMEFREPEVRRETSFSESNRTVLPVGSPELKLEMATAIGLGSIAKKIAGEHPASGNLAERERFDLRYGFRTDALFARRPQSLAFCAGVVIQPIRK